MAKNVEIGLDVSSLISDYRAAISAMESAGAKVNITQGLTKSLDKLEQQFKDLSNEGAFGKTNAKDIANYQGRVDKVYSSLGQLGKELERIAKDKQAFPSSSMAEFEKKLADARQKALDLQNALTQKLQSFGLSGELKDALTSEESLKAALKTELEERQKIEQAAKAALAADQEAANIARKAGSTGRGANAVSSDMMNTSYGGFNGTELKTIRQDLNATFAQLIRQGEDFETVWKKGIENSLLGTEKELNDFIVDVERLKAILQEVIEKRDQAIAGSTANQNYSAAVAAREQIGDSSGGEIHFSESTLALINEIIAGIKELSAEETNITNIESQRSAVEKEATNAEQALDSATRNLSNATEESKVQFDQSTSAIYNTKKSAEEASASFDQMKNRILTLLSATSVFNLIKRTVKETYEDVKNLDKSFASIAMVTNYSVNDMWSSYSQYADMASQLGQKTNDVIQASALFYQQGLNTDEALELTTDTMKLATLAGNDFQTATQEMTSALRGFKMEMDEGAHVTDVYSELAAHAAASVDDIAQAMARTASIANSAGMSFENTSAFLTQMIETTQESAENIGTSLKTIIARFTELKENVSGTADSEFEDLDYNKVDKALKSVGVSLKDTTGQFRDLDDVFLDLSEKWDTLDRNTQRYVATVAAGSRQQSRFIAMMDNYDRTVELMELAADSEGKADEQFEKYADTMEYKLNQLSTKWEEFRVNALNSDLFKGLIDGLTSFMSKIENINWKKLLVLGPVAIWAAKNFISTFLNTAKSTISGFKSIGATAANSLLAGFNKRLNKGVQIPTEIDYKAATKTKNDITSLVSSTNKNLAKNGVQILQKVDTSKLKSAEDSYYALAKAGKDIGLSAEEAAQQADIMLDTFGKSGDKVRELATDLQGAQTEINNFVKNQNKLEGMKQGFAAVGQAAVSAFAMIASGADAIDVLKMMGIQLGIMALQFTLQEVAAQIHQKQLTAIQNKGGAERIAAVVSEQAAETAAITAGGVTQGAAAEATGLAVGGGLTTGFIAGTAGIGAIVIAITAAITGLVVLIASLVKSAKENKKTLEKDLEEAQERLKASQQIANSTKSSAAEAEETAESAKKMKKEYEELANKVVKTEEEQERYNELVNDIRETFPEIVTYYNETTGELQIQNDLWDSIIQKADILAQKANQANFVAQMNALNDEIDVSNKQFKVSKQKYENYDNAISSIFGGSYDYWDADTEITEKGSFGDYFGKTYGDMLSSNMSKDEIEYILDDLSGNIKFEDLVEWLDSLNNNSNIDMSMVMLGLAEVGDNFENSTNSNAIYLQQLVDSNKNQLQQLKDLNSQEVQTAEASKKALVASKISSDLGVDISIGQFMADAIYSDENKALIKEKGSNLFKDTFNVLQSGFSHYDVSDVSDLRSYAKNNHGGTNDNLRSWSVMAEKVDDLGISAVDVLNQINSVIEADPSSNLKKFSQSDWDDARKDDEDWKDYLNSLEYWDEAYEALRLQKEEELKSLSEEQQEAVLNFYSNASTYSKKELEKAQEDLMNMFDEGDPYRTTAENNVQSYIDNLNTAIETAQEGINTTFNFDGWSTSDVNALTSAYKNLMTVAGEDSAQSFTNSMLEVFKNNPAMTKAQLNEILQFDWDKIDITNAEEYSQKIIDILSSTMDEDKAAELAENFVNEATKAGVASFGVHSQETIDSIMDDVTSKLDKWLEGYSGLSDAITSQLEDGMISYTQSREVESALEELGLKAADYLTYNEDGTIILDEKKLTKAFKDRINDADSLVELAQEETQAKIDSLKSEVNLLETERDSLIATQEKLKAERLITAEKQRQTAEGLTGQARDDAFKKAEASSDISSIDKEISRLQNEYAEKISEYNTQINEYQQQLNKIVPGSEAYLEVQNKITAAQRELTETRNSWLPEEDQIKSVEEAQEDYNDALDAYNDQLETVAEKQETLNEKLEAYNELLYGSTNRKSSLDYLYNYDEAINSFNDEISRAQDLLSDASSMDEATSALERYASATHNLIAEETAKQQVLQAGLANYADKIENGSYSYTNQETGEVTNINFGDYARKDERTGKYVIDQRLINESNFGDDWKDLLEEQVSNYNKYSEDLLKSEDNVRKAEKTLRDERESALKNYVALEDKVKEVLKAEYQEQVDNLTDMYDSMKEADDDYITALQEAIEKQRELREQENAWEDLAEKEKKLSLMQRDTSGANQVETMELEEEIQEDRESLLDDAIDNIIDGLSDLYESQSELRDAELELKEALLENDAYWAGLSEATAQGFVDLDDATEWYLQHSLELTDMTAAGAESDILGFQDTYSSATEYMAMQLMDNTSETGDFINDAITVTGEEAMEIVQTTSETFTTEAQRAFNETQKTFETDMEKAEQDIKDAKDALQEAVNKLGELAAAANAAAEAYAAAKRAQDELNGINPDDSGENPSTPPTTTASSGTKALFDWVDLKNKMNGMSYEINNNGSIDSGTFSFGANSSFTHAQLAGYIDKLYKGNELNELRQIAGVMSLSTTKNNGSTALTAQELYDKIKQRMILSDNSLSSVFKYAEGGLVDYTGPAWVDGTFNRPEAFLSADDTERIGNAAKILADIPWIDRDTDNSSVVTNNGGDVSVEINLNIDHISSDTDLDEMIERVKEEIVEVARPTGTNVILQQQL